MPFPRPSQKQEEDTEEVTPTWSLSSSELWEIEKDFSHHPGEHITIWLLQCWASSLELEDKEARQLGSLAKEPGIDKALGKKTQASKGDWYQMWGKGIPTRKIFDVTQENEL